MTPKKWLALRLLADCRLLSLPQLALLLEDGNARPRSAREKSARRHLRPLVDAGLIAVLPVSRASLAGADEPNDETLLYGSAPNVYTVTARGVRALAEEGVVDESYKARAYPAYGPKNALFLAHELMVRDSRVWLERLLYPHPGSKVLRWEDGPDAALALASGSAVRPDAWFVFQTGDTPASPKLIGLVEADRRSERNPRRWTEKASFYAELFLKEGGVEAATGYRHARVLVLTPDAARRDSLAALIFGECESLGHPDLAGRFWLAARADLLGSDLHSPLWRVAGTDCLSPMMRHAGEKG